MKKTFLIGMAILFISSANGQAKINIDSASKHFGEKVTICSKVYGVKFIESSKMTFIDLGAKYPDSKLTLVIPGKDKSNFKEAPETVYAGKNICVTGTVINFKGKTEIVVSSPDAITIE
ncbi:MAG: hypothetical protein ABIT07_09050 [Ferruginibacter sp.]